MSMEAQFYEARRRQSAVERRQSLQAEREARHPAYEILYIPVRVLRPVDKHARCTCSAMHRVQLTSNDPSLYQRNRDIYPRPAPLATNVRRHSRRAKLLHRFSSTDYLQQW